MKSGEEVDMDCEKVQENLALYLYDELTSEARGKVEAHVEQCVDCAGELAELRAMLQTMSARATLEVEPNLLASVRIALDQRLEEETPRHGWLPAWLAPKTWRGLGNFRRLSPALLASILFVVFGGGLGALYQFGGWGQAGQNPPATLAVRQNSAAPRPAVAKKEVAILAHAAQVANDAVHLRAVPGVATPRLAESARSKEVLTAQAMRPVRPMRPAVDNGGREPAGDRAQMLSGTGSMSSANPWLMTASEGGMRSIGARAMNNGMSRMELEPAEESSTRQSLLRTLHSNRSAALRLHAAEALAPLVALDLQVRNALLDCLKSDDNAGVRAGALNALAPVAIDSRVREVLLRLARQESNQYLRTRAARLLAMDGDE